MALNSWHKHNWNGCKYNNVSRSHSNQFSHSIRCSVQCSFVRSFVRVFIPKKWSWLHDNWIIDDAKANSLELGRKCLDYATIGVGGGRETFLREWHGGQIHRFQKEIVISCGSHNVRRDDVFAEGLLENTHKTEPFRNRGGNTFVIPVITCGQSCDA